MENLDKDSNAITVLHCKMGTLTDKRGTEIQMLTLGDSSDWRSEVAKGNLVTIWKTCSSPEEMAENNLVIQNHIGVLGD